MKFSVKSVFQPLGSDSVIVIPINLRGISYVNANVLQLCIFRFGGRSFQSYRHTGIWGQGKTWLSDWFPCWHEAHSNPRPVAHTACTLTTTPPRQAESGADKNGGCLLGRNEENKTGRLGAGDRALNLITKAIIYIFMIAPRRQDRSHWVIQHSETLTWSNRRARMTAACGSPIQGLT